MAKPIQEPKKESGRPTNQELYNKPPDIDPAAQPAVDKVHAEYGATKDLEGYVKEGGGYEVMVGKVVDEGMDTAVYSICEAEVDSALTIVSMEERPNQAPGQAKHAQPK